MKSDIAFLVATRLRSIAIDGEHAIVSFQDYQDSVIDEYWATIFDVTTGKSVVDFDAVFKTGGGINSSVSISGNTALYVPPTSGPLQISRMYVAVTTVPEPSGMSISAMAVLLHWHTRRQRSSKTDCDLAAQFN